MTTPNEQQPPLPEVPYVPYITAEQKITLAERLTALRNGRAQLVANLSAQDAAIDVLEKLLKAEVRGNPPA